jgi:hypothetical protein
MIIAGAIAVFGIVGFTAFTVHNEGGDYYCPRSGQTAEVLAYEFSPIPLGVQCMYDGPEGEIVENVDLATVPAVLFLALLVAGVVIRIRQD